MIDFKKEAEQILQKLRDPNKLITVENEVDYLAGCLEKIAREGTAGAVVFPVPMRQIKSADMSFSGLKTAAMRIVEKHPTKKLYGL